MVRLFAATAEEIGNVWVFFGFGDAQLAEALCRQILAQAIADGLRRKHHRVGVLLAIAGEAGVISQFWLFGASEAFKISIEQGLGDFACAVGAEIQIQHRVAIGQQHFRLYHRGLYKLIVFTASISGL